MEEVADRDEGLLAGRIARLETAQAVFEESRRHFDSHLRALEAAAANHLQALTEQVAEIHTWQSGTRVETATFQNAVSGHLRSLTEQIHALSDESKILTYELYAVPYTAAPDALMTVGSDGRLQIGYHDRSQSETDTYRGFEDIFRGTEDFIRERQRIYVGLLDGRAPVLDVGCGRGEFLDLLAEAHIHAVGVDLDAGMIARCREKGHDVVHADVVRYLADQPDDSIGVIFAAQVIEHLSYADLLSFLDLSLRKLMPGGRLIAETVNPHAISAFKVFWVDLTHHSPIFPEVAVALCWLRGFDSAVVQFPHGTGDLDRDRRTQGEYAVLAAKAPVR